MESITVIAGARGEESAACWGMNLAYADTQINQENKTRTQAEGRTHVACQDLTEN